MLLNIINNITCLSLALVVPVVPSHTTEKPKTPLQPHAHYRKDDNTKKLVMFTREGRSKYMSDIIETIVLITTPKDDHKVRLTGERTKRKMKQKDNKEKAKRTKITTVS